MASGSPGDVQYGLPYTGTPVLPSTSRAHASQTVLDMYRQVNVRIPTSDTDNHYTPDGNLYHE